MTKQAYLAIDMGASSGRHIIGTFDGQKLALEEMYRFENGPVHVCGSMYWDLLNQWSHIKAGMKAAGVKFSDSIVSVGVDTWGVDFGLLGRNDELLSNPRHYRDSSTNGILEKAFEIVSRKEIFQQTGLQFIQFNTLFQLLAMRLENSSVLDAAEHLLMVPDIFHWLMTGEKANEFTDASTSQILNPQTGQWSTQLMQSLELPTSILGKIVPPGTTLGPLLKSVAKETGLTNSNAVLPGTHDTASAVMAVPTAEQVSEKPNWCYISSGTWSLMGVEIPSPIVNDKCAELNFTNEGGVGNTVRLLKNIGGLWLVQECRRIWNLAGNNHDWAELITMAEQAAPLVSVIDPDHPSLMAPDDMPKAICELCRATNQPIPENEGAVIRCALESLALKYRLVLNWLEELTGSQLDTIHIVGGGTQNHQLCQMTADACNRHVIAGPVEATAIGNLLMQAVAAGDIGSIAEARMVIRDSFEVIEYQPSGDERWNEAYEKFISII